MSEQAFITSGILERYALGMISEEEAAEVKEMASQHTEVRNELAEIRLAIKGYLMQYQVAPPPGMKDKILNEIQKNRPVSTRTQTETGTTRQERSKSRRQSEKTGISVGGILAVLFGLALIAASYIAYTFYQEAEQAKAEIVALNEQVQTSAGEVDELKNTQELLQREIDVLRHEGIEPVSLKGTRLASDAKAIIYWNGQEKTTLIDVKKLPDVPDGKSLILWVNVDRTPRNLGPLLPNSNNTMGALPFIEEPESFFVTLEDKEETPTSPDRRNVLMTGQLP